MKAELRQKLRSVLRQLDKDCVHGRSLQAAERLLTLREYTRAEVVMIFMSMPQEVDTTAIVLQAWNDRKRVLAPRIAWDQRRILPVEIHSFDVLAANTIGLREPIKGQPIPVSYIDLVIVPGLGFDPYGNRIGRGSGFYDRFLSQPDFRGVACGLAFQEQYVDQIPTGPYDRQIHLLVTDQHVYRFNGRRKARRRVS